MLEKFVKAGMLTKTSLISIYMHVLETGDYDDARNVVLGLNKYMHEMDKFTRIKVVKHLELNSRKHSKKLKEARAMYKHATEKTLLEAAERENLLIQALLAHLAMRIMADLEKRDDLFAAVDAAGALELTFDALSNKILLRIKKNMQKIIVGLDREIENIEMKLLPETLKERLLNGLINNKAKDDPAYLDKQLFNKLNQARKKADKLLLTIKKRTQQVTINTSSEDANNKADNGSGLKVFNGFAFKLFRKLPFGNNIKTELELIEQAI